MSTLGTPPDHQWTVIAHLKDQFAFRNLLNDLQLASRAGAYWHSCECFHVERRASTRLESLLWRAGILLVEYLNLGPAFRLRCSPAPCQLFQRTAMALL